jgi:Bacterial antitoxin of ParD toxin-antitoxin type II system and RHH
MSKNTFVSLGDHFEGFIEERIARDWRRPLAVR